MKTFNSVGLKLFILVAIMVMATSSWALNMPKTVVARVSVADGSVLAAGDIRAQVTDASGQPVSLQTAAVDGVLSYDEANGIITIVMANFSNQWVEGDQIVISVNSPRGSAQSVVNLNDALLQLFTSDANLDLHLLH